jgi:hypothetical protein
METPNDTIRTVSIVEAAVIGEPDPPVSTVQGPKGNQIKQSRSGRALHRLMVSPCSRHCAA